MLTHKRTILLDLYAVSKAKKKEELLNVDDFVNVGAAYLDKKELARQIKTHMIEGLPIEFNNIQLIEAFKIGINNNIPKVSLTGKSDLSEIYRW